MADEPAFLRQSFQKSATLCHCAMMALSGMWAALLGSNGQGAGLMVTFPLSSLMLAAI